MYQEHVGRAVSSSCIFTKPWQASHSFFVANWRRCWVALSNCEKLYREWAGRLGKKRSLGRTMLSWLIKYPLHIWSLFFFRCSLSDPLRHEDAVGMSGGHAGSLLPFSSVWLMYVINWHYLQTFSTKGRGSKTMLRLSSPIRISWLKAEKAPALNKHTDVETKEGFHTSKPPNDFQDINSLANTVLFNCFRAGMKRRKRKEKPRHHTWTAEEDAVTSRPTCLRKGLHWVFCFHLRRNHLAKGVCERKRENTYIYVCAYLLQGTLIYI